MMAFGPSPDPLDPDEELFPIDHMAFFVFRPDGIWTLQEYLRENGFERQDHDELDVFVKKWRNNHFEVRIGKKVFDVISDHFIGGPYDLREWREKLEKVNEYFRQTSE